MVMRPTAAAPAASDPEIAANMPHTRTVADPNPPLANLVTASATSRNLRLRPVLTSTSPVRMKSGTAVSAKASIPSKRLSPTSDSGSAPDISSMMIAADPIAAQTGTASATSTTKRMTGP